MENEVGAVTGGFDPWLAKDRMSRNLSFPKPPRRIRSVENPKELIKQPCYLLFAPPFSLLINVHSGNRECTSCPRNDYGEMPLQSSKFWFVKRGVVSNRYPSIEITGFDARFGDLDYRRI